MKPYGLKSGAYSQLDQARRRSSGDPPEVRVLNLPDDRSRTKELGVIERIERLQAEFSRPRF